MKYLSNWAVESWLQPLLYLRPRGSTMRNLRPIYRIRVKGRLAERWSEWFDGMTITYDAERGETVLQGTIVDQASLHGVLNKIRDLGLPLLSLKCVNQDLSQT